MAETLALAACSSSDSASPPAASSGATAGSPSASAGGTGGGAAAGATSAQATSTAGSTSGDSTSAGTGGAAATAALDFVTLLHGSDATKGSLARDVAVDATGNVYVTGGTTDPTFPTTAGAYQTTFGRGGVPTSTGSGGPMDVFVMKFAPDGSLVWSTLLGGPNYDRAYAIEVDATGVYVAGRAGAGFPTTAGVVQPTFAGDSSPNAKYGKQDGFIAKLSLDGSALLWSTYFGDAGPAYLRDMAIDGAGNVYAGVSLVEASAGPFPHITAGAFQSANAGMTDGVVAKLDPTASHVDWCTYVGGPGADGITPTVRVDTAGNAYFVQGAAANAPTTAGALQPAFGGGPTDLLVTKLSPNGSVVFSTYFGGNGGDDGETHSMWIGPSGEIVIGAYTTSTNLPTTPGAIQPALGASGRDAYVARLSADGKALLACTYLSGTGGGMSEGFAMMPSGNVIVSGSTSSPDFSVSADATQIAPHGGKEAFVVELTPDLTTLVFATLLGGSSDDEGRATATDALGNVYVVGETLSHDFPATPAAFQAAFVGNTDPGDGFIAKWRLP